jgi:hypothetical protein
MNIQCPKCHFEFDAKGNLKNKITGPISYLKVSIRRYTKSLFKELSVFEQVKDAITTVCPKCGKEVPYKEYKFFGFLSPKAVEKGLIVFFLLFLATAIFMIVKNIIIINIYT